MPKIDIFRQRGRALRLIEEAGFISFEAEVDRAIEIAEEVYNDFKDEAGSKGISGILGGIEFEIKRETKNIRGLFKSYRITESFSISVPESSAGPNLVFNVLDQGRGALGASASYGLKAWPMRAPRRRDFGNSPMTQPDSASLSPAVSQERIAFRPFIAEPIDPRNFTKHLSEEINRRLRSEGLRSVTVEFKQD